ncbi:hypothetical protein [Methyloprofundus sp.]|uniref:hypothetical protein n=1 Tax=Methyloprofundus sp. TaxID=2020875 RepID=UPI003D0CCBE7
MLRLSNIKLPLEHTDSDLRLAITSKLGIKGTELLDYSVYKRSYDARQKRNIFFIYSLDVDTSKNSQLLQHCAEDQQVQTS